MKGFVDVTLKDGISKVLVAIDAIASVESVDYIFSRITLRNGKSYQLFDSVEDVVHLMEAAK